MEFSKIVLGYLVYLPLMLALTFFVSRQLFRNARVFMLEIFHGQQDIAFSTNRLFEMGFYLLNLGFGLWILEINNYGFDETYRSLIEVLSAKLGGFSIYLGVMLFINLLLFFKGRNRARRVKSA